MENLAFLVIYTLFYLYTISTTRTEPFNRPDIICRLGYGVALALTERPEAKGKNPAEK